MNLWRDAIRRIGSSYETFDKIFVLFNGSKDSMAVLQLAMEVGKARGIPPHIIWRDPELVDKHTLAFIRSFLRRFPAEHVHHFAIPCRSVMAHRGTRKDYIQWDPARAHFREMPQTRVPPRLCDHKGFLTWFAGRLRGKVLFLSGVRAADDIGHRRSSRHWVVSGLGRWSTGRPIIDWSMDDVDQYLEEVQAPINPVYAMLEQHDVRGTVSAPLGHRWMRAARGFALVDPNLIEFILHMWPHLETDILFKPQSGKEYVIAYAQSQQHIRLWIEQNIREEEQPNAIIALGKAMTLHYKQPAKYPLDSILRYFMRGAWKKKIRPIERKPRKKKGVGHGQEGEEAGTDILDPG